MLPPSFCLLEMKDVVNATLYLLSDKSDMINGTTLPIDGGFLASHWYQLYRWGRQNICNEV